MDLDRWRRVEQVLDRALMSDPSSWPALLDDTCGGDPELRGEVEALLAHRSAAAQFLASPPSAAASALVADAREHGAPHLEERRVDALRIVSASALEPPAPDVPP